MTDASVIDDKPETYRVTADELRQFVERFDDEGARKGYCLYKVGCKGPTTYNACSTVEWNDGLSWPVKSGHGCLGCAEDDFWDKGSFYSPITKLDVMGNVEADADRIGKVVAGAAAIVSGLIAVLLRLYDDTAPREVLDYEPAFVQRLGLDVEKQQLSRGQGRQPLG